MDIETLIKMDVEANELINTWTSGHFSENANIKNCTEKMGNRLSEVYGAALASDQLVEYGRTAGKWAIAYGAGKGLDYLLPKVGKALKQVYHDHAVGKAAPKPKEFKNYLLQVEGAALTCSGAEATLNLTNKDGSVD
jgi:hypothetical protein